MNKNRLSLKTIFYGVPLTQRKDMIILGVFFFLSIIFILLLNLPWSPRFYSMSIDNGIFAYAGKLITQGALPYRDYWDNIPPVINYIDAFTFLVAGPSPWTIWWLNIIWLIIITIILSLVIYKMAGLIASIISGLLLIVLVMDGDLFSGGNMTELFSLLPQILTLLALYKFTINRRTRWLLVLGAVNALAFLTKQTAIGLGLASVLIITGSEFPKPEWKKVFNNIILVGASFGIVMAAILFYWGINNGLRDFFDQVIIFNLYYTRGGISPARILLVLRTLFFEDPYKYLMPLISLSYLYLFLVNIKRFVRFFQKERAFDKTLAPSQANYLAAFVAFPINIFFIAMSAYNYSHYYTLLIPSAIIIILYLSHESIKRLCGPERNWIAFSIGLITLSFLSLWLVNSINKEFPRAAALDTLNTRLYGEYPMSEMERYITSQTDPEDVILVWDMHTEIYFRTNRNSPSRFIHPIPLLSASGKEKSNFELFLEDLTNEPPELIIANEFNPSGVPFFDVPDERICPNCLPEVQTGLRALRSFVYANYYIDSYINDWIIYKRIE